MSSWWDQKLNNKGDERKSSVPPTTPNYILPAFKQQAPAQTSAPSPQSNPNGQIDMATAIRSWKGGEAHRIDGGLTCPRCGSKNVFSRSNGSVGGRVPAPRCFECGWNGIYEQADQASWSV
jgi:hypothetical protein